MRIKYYEKDSGEQGYVFWCLACKRRHSLPLANSPNGHLWTFDGNHRYPTFSPSLHLTGSGGSYVDRKWVAVGAPVTICHLHVQYGMLVYTADCPHLFAGQTHPMVELDE